MSQLTTLTATHTDTLLVVIFCFMVNIDHLIQVFLFTGSSLVDYHF